MNLTKELLAHILAKSADPEAVAKELCKYSSICKSRWLFCDRRREADEIRTTTLTKIKAAELVLQSVCDHPDSMRHVDPAGGNAWVHECAICGKQW